MIEQLPPAATAVPTAQVPPDFTKSAALVPPVVNDVKFSAAIPVLETVNVSDGAAVPAGRLIGLRYGVFSALNILPVFGQLVGVIDALCIFRSSRRCLHDNLANTVVIKA